MHAQLYGEARSPVFGLNHVISPYFVCTRPLVTFAMGSKISCAGLIRNYKRERERERERERDGHGFGLTLVYSVKCKYFLTHQL